MGTAGQTTGGPLRRDVLLTAAVSTLPLPALAAAEAWPARTVNSADGTSITYRVEGKGDPLVMLHGGGSNAKEYFAVAALLKDRYTLALIERRNYGISGATGSPHTFAQEAADVAAVLDTFDRPSYLFGHSAGGLVAMHAAREHAAKVRKLALYEPPLSGGGPVVDATLAEMRRLNDEGKVDEALALAYHKIVGYPPELARQRLALRRDQLRTLIGPAMLDIEALAAQDPDPKPWAALPMPVLLIVGEKSAEHPLRDSVAALHSALPGASLRELPGQEHVAYMMGPQLLADALREFFTP